MKGGKIRLDREEAELLDSYEAGGWHTIEGWQAKAEGYQEHAHATFKKEGIPYQTLIASVLHKYVSRRLVERGEDS